MTFASTITSLVFMPAWYYSLGSALTTNETKIEIPFIALISNLLVSILPCLVGLLLIRKYPNLKNRATRIAKPFSLFVIISIVIISSLVKYHVYTLIHSKMWLCVTIPWAGFFIAGGIAALFRFSRKQVVTISVETGIQNVSIPFLIILSSFPSPDADYAIRKLTKKIYFQTKKYLH